MLDKIEFYSAAACQDKEYITDVLNRFALIKGIKAVNFNSIFLSLYSNLNNKTNLYVNIDKNWSLLDSDIRIQLMNLMLERFPFITGFNICPSVDGINEINQNFNELVKVRNLVTAQIRLFLEIAQFQPKELMKIGKQIEEADLDGIVVSNWTYKKYPISDMLIIQNELASSISVPVGICTKCPISKLKQYPMNRIPYIITSVKNICSL